MWCEAFHQLQQGQSPLPIVAGPMVTQSPDPNPKDGRMKVLIPLSMELLNRLRLTWVP